MTSLGALTGWLTLLSGAEARIAAAERLSRLSDEELAARGTSRREAIRRITGAA